MSNISALQENLAAEEACARVRKAARTGSVRLVTKIYYPYFAFEHHATAPALAGQRRLTIHCLVDGIRGLSLTSDAPMVQPIAVRRSGSLQATLPIEEARLIAHRYVAQTMQRRFRAIAAFDLRLESEDSVFRGFWVFEADGCRVLVDSVSGSLHTLE